MTSVVIGCYILAMSVVAITLYSFNSNLKGSYERYNKACIKLDVKYKEQFVIKSGFYAGTKGVAIMSDDTGVTLDIGDMAQRELCGNLERVK